MFAACYNVGLHNSMLQNKLQRMCANKKRNVFSFAHKKSFFSFLSVHWLVSHRFETDMHMHHLPTVRWKDLRFSPQPPIGPFESNDNENMEEES